MFVLESYSVAVFFCVITMLCWGSWANTQKLAGKTWRFELFYWDYVFGVLLMALVFAFTLGSMGSSGRGFLEDLSQADAANLGSAFLGGVVFNAANILLVAAIAVAANDNALTHVVIAVADGVGSAARSEIGAEAACASAVRKVAMLAGAGVDPIEGLDAMDLVAHVVTELLA